MISALFRSSSTRRRAAIGASARAAGALLVGCNNAGQGAITGAGVGALAGLIIGSTTGAAGAGAAIGGATGGVIGDQNARRSRRSYYDHGHYYDHGPSVTYEYRYQHYDHRPRKHHGRYRYDNCPY